MTLEDEDCVEMIKVNVEKTERAYKSAFLLFNDQDYDGAANRTYYALFHAETALLHMRGIKGTTHKQVHNFLSSEFIKDGYLPKDTRRKINDIQSTRRVADYSDERSAPKEEVELAMTQTRDFLQLAEKFLGKLALVEGKAEVIDNHTEAENSDTALSPKEQAVKKTQVIYDNKAIKVVEAEKDKVYYGVIVSTTDDYAIQKIHAKDMVVLHKFDDLDLRDAKEKDFDDFEKVLIRSGKTKFKEVLTGREAEKAFLDMENEKKQDEGQDRGR
ncbi:hypothetical protein FACS1894187_11220 [Synergistales bacterium]|nr:hypothetical protein FACS1894187_11220 [Synergistales bacterium]